MQLLPRADNGADAQPWAGGNPSARGELVKLVDLKATLPAGTMWLSPHEREHQLAERFADFQKRHII